jgi:hypothetical protein
LPEILEELLAARKRAKADLKVGFVANQKNSNSWLLDFF